MANLGDHDQHAGLLHSGVDLEVEGERLSSGLECSAQFLKFGGFISSTCNRKLCPHKEALRGRITKLRRIDNIEVVLHKECSDRVDNTGAVGTGKGQNEARSHDK